MPKLKVLFVFNGRLLRWTRGDKAELGYHKCSAISIVNRPGFSYAKRHGCAYAMRMVLRKNVTIGFSPDEYLRLQGAAAIARMPVSTYLKWLLQGSPVDGMSRNMSAVLAHLDEISSAIARLSESLPGQPTALVQGPPITQRELLRKNLKERGFPSSTIRQVDITLDEMEKSR